MSFNNTQTTVFITVPHATCPTFQFKNKTLHPCDTLSSQSASILSKSLSNSGIVNHVFIGDIPRTKDDLNRERSRLTTKYRRELTQEMSEKKPSAVLDIHSYPSTGTGFAPDSEIVILDNSISYPKKYSIQLNNMLRNSGISSYLIRGSEVNDIEEEARLVYGLRSVLLEFNESLDVSRIKEISNVITEWI